MWLNIKKNMYKFIKLLLISIVIVQCMNVFTLYDLTICFRGLFYLSILIVMVVIGYIVWVAVLKVLFNKVCLLLERKIKVKIEYIKKQDLLFLKWGFIITFIIINYKCNDKLLFIINAIMCVLSYFLIKYRNNITMKIKEIYKQSIILLAIRREPIELIIIYFLFPTLLHFIFKEFMATTSIGIINSFVEVSCYYFLSNELRDSLNFIIIAVVILFVILGLFFGLFDSNDDKRMLKFFIIFILLIISFFIFVIMLLFWYVFIDDIYFREFLSFGINNPNELMVYSKVLSLYTIDAIQEMIVKYYLFLIFCGYVGKIFINLYKPKILNKEKPID